MEDLLSSVNSLSEAIKLLSNNATIFDPLGLIDPIVITAKIIM